MGMTAKSLGAVIAGCLVILVSPVTGWGAYDPPHTGDNAVDCGNCHYTNGAGAPPSWMSPGGDDNTVNNLRCMQCHTLYKTHSAAATGSSLWQDRGGWQAECVNCHNPHYQMQSKRWGAESYLTTGTVSSVGVWQPLTNDTLITLSAPLGAEYQGYYLVPNTAYRNFLYKIKTLTNGQSQVTVKGKVGVGAVFPKAGPGTPFAIVYARNIKDAIQYSNPGAATVGSLQVKMFRQGGTRGPGDSAHADESVCYVCHTMVSPAAAPGVAEHQEPSAACTACHTHDEGFRPSCSACHAFPPLDASGLVSSPLPTGSATAGAHGRHATPSGMNYGCDICHNQGMPTTPISGNNRIQIGFSLFGTVGGTYDGQTLINGYTYEGKNGTTVTTGGSKTCSNIYCHGSTMDNAGDKNGGTNITPVWDNPASAACGTCHGATAANPPVRGSHRTHTKNDTWAYAPNDVPPFNNYIYGRNLACSVCHNNPEAKHINHAADWSFDTATYPWLSGAQYRGSATGSSSPVPGTYGECSNVYCHSIIQTGVGGPLTGAPGEYKTPAWGSRTSGNCGTCHAVDAGHAYWAEQPGTPPEMSTGSHTNHLNAFGSNPELGPTPGGPGRCAVCHNYVGSDSLNGCASVCHNRGDLHVNHQINVRFAPKHGASAAYSGSPEPGDGYGSCANTYCHGSYPGSGKNASPAWGVAASGACGTCHGASNSLTPVSGKHAAHADLAYYDFACTLCHKDIVGGSSPASYTIADKGKHVNGFVDYKFDPSDPRTAGGTYSIASGTAAPSDGVTPRSFGTCNNIYCHSNVQPEGGVGSPSSYANPAWAVSGTAACGSCHAGGHGALIGSGSHTAHLAYDFTTSNIFKCIICHSWDQSLSLTCSSCHNFHVTTEYTKHANYKVEVLFDPAFNRDASYGKSPSFTPGTGYSDCANTYCHGNGTAVATGTIEANISAAWGITGPLACNTCHGNPPSYPNTAPKANSHQSPSHAGFPCWTCHATTTAADNTISSRTTHVNKAYDVDPGPGIAFSYSYAPTGGVCSSVSCHDGGATKTWGGP